MRASCRVRLAGRLNAKLPTLFLVIRGSFPTHSNLSERCPILILRLSAPGESAPQFRTLLFRYCQQASSIQQRRVGSPQAFPHITPPRPVFTEAFAHL